MIDNFGNFQNLEFLAQLFLAALLGALVGIEREASKKTAGMRTFSLVSLGSALFSIISLYPFAMNGIVSPSVNLTHIAAQIVTGVGFIGAGLIIFDKTSVRGVTTAAGLWLAAAIGMAVGFRFYLLAIFTTFLALFIFVFLWRIEETIFKKGQSDGLS